jgi:hypothetical protein
MGSIIAELKAAGIASGRVRGGEAGPGDVHLGTDTDPYKRFVVLVELGTTRFNRAPVQVPRYGIRAYAPTYQDARALYGEISEVLHIAGGRVSGTDVALYQSRDDGASASADPRTRQPYYEAIFEVIAGTQAFV